MRLAQTADFWRVFKVSRIPAHRWRNWKKADRKSNLTKESIGGMLNANLVCAPVSSDFAQCRLKVDVSRFGLLWEDCGLMSVENVNALIWRHACMSGVPSAFSRGKN